MEKAKIGDPLVISTLKTIKDLHRNPLIHPEEHLNVEEAVCLINIAFSAISYMMKQIPDTKITKAAKALGVTSTP